MVGLVAVIVDGRVDVSNDGCVFVWMDWLMGGDEWIEGLVVL